MSDLSIDLRLGTDKLRNDAKQAQSIISQIYGSGQANAGARPISAANMPPMLGQGNGRTLADEIAKQESKAKASKYSGEAVGGAFGGMGGGGVNTAGSRFQIQKAVINVMHGRVNVVGSKSSLPQSPTAADQVSGTDTGGGGDTGKGGYSPQSMFSRRPGETGAQFAGRGFMQGSHVGMQMGSNLLPGITDVYNMTTSAIGGAYHAYRDYRASRGTTAAAATHAAPMTAPTEHHQTTGANAASAHREGGSRLSGSFAALPIVGALTGFMMAGAQRMAEAYVSKISSQIGTIGLVGNMSAGGGGAIGQLGYSAAAKGQLIMQAQQHMTTTGFIESGKSQGAEHPFAYSAKFGHSQGIGAGAGMAMAAQLGELSKAQHTGNGGIYSGTAALRNVANYAYGYEGGGSRRLGQIAQFITGIATQQQTQGGGGDVGAVAEAFSRMKGHGTLAEAQHTISGLSSTMSGGAHSGSAISGLLMMGAASQGGSMKDVLKAADKGITKQNIASLQGIPQEMLEMVMFGQGSKMTEAEHMAQAVHGKSNYKMLDQKTMGGTYNQGNQGAANVWAFEQERIADMPGSAMAASAVRSIHDASMAFTKELTGMVTKIQKLKSLL